MTHETPKSVALDDIRATVQQWLALVHTVRNAKTRASELARWILPRMAATGAEIGTLKGIPVVRLAAEGGTRLDKAALRRDCPELLERYTVTEEPRPRLRLVCGQGDAA